VSALDSVVVRLNERFVGEVRYLGVPAEGPLVPLWSLWVLALRQRVAEVVSVTRSVPVAWEQATAVAKGLARRLAPLSSTRSADAVLAAVETAWRLGGRDAVAGIPVPSAASAESSRHGETVFPGAVVCRVSSTPSTECYRALIYPHSGYKEVHVPVPSRYSVGDLVLAPDLHETDTDILVVGYPRKLTTMRSTYELARRYYERGSRVVRVR